MAPSNRFVSDFAAWAREAGYPARVLRRLPQLLRRLPEILGEQDELGTLFVRTLPNDHALRLRSQTPTHGMYTSSDCVVFWCAGPYWGRRHLSSDQQASEVVEDFLFFASQHALRSRILSSTAAIALTYDLLFDFRSAGVQRLVFGPDSFAPTFEAGLAHIHQSLPPDTGPGAGRKTRAIRGWMLRMNTMDPLVQRGLYQYWRAKALWNAGFCEDAVTALDALSSVAGEALNCWTGAGTLKRSDLGSALGLGPADCRALAHLYELRCAFGAHPAASKWWDFSEIYADSVDSAFDTASRLLGAICDLETLHRSVEPAPTHWSKWLEQNAEMLLDAVWFTHVP